MWPDIKQPCQEKKIHNRFRPQRFCHKICSTSFVLGLELHWWRQVRQLGNLALIVTMMSGTTDSRWKWYVPEPIRTLNLHLALLLQEVAEIFLGGAILRSKYHYVPPFLKRMHQFIKTPFGDMEDLKACLLGIDNRCPATDPSRIVNEYLDPWWKDPSFNITHLEIAEGLPNFVQQVWYYWFDELCDYNPTS